MIRPFGVNSDNHCHNWTSFATVNGEGVNSRLLATLNEIRRCCERTVAEGGRRVFFAGDLFHVRGSIPPTVFNPLKITLLECQAEYGVEFVLIPGNHDLELTDEKESGSAVETLSKETGIKVVHTSAVFKEEMVAVIGWKDSLDDLRREISVMAEGWHEDLRTEVTLIIHAPLNGVIKGIPDNGLSSEELAAYGFGNVLVGHYHSHVGFPGGVYSIGATTHQTWNDVGTLAGFLIVKHDNVEHVESHAPKFVDFNFEWSEEAALRECKGNYVRVKLDEADEAKIREVRTAITADFKANSVVIHATPISEVIRSGGVTAAVAAGGSIRDSVSSFIDDAEIPEFKEEVKTVAHAILKEVEDAAV